jgi:hypothetical protein
MVCCQKAQSATECENKGLWQLCQVTIWQALIHIHRPIAPPTAKNHIPVPMSVITSVVGLVKRTWIKVASASNAATRYATLPTHPIFLARVVYLHDLVVPVINANDPVHKKVRARTQPFSCAAENSAKEGPVLKARPHRLQNLKE